MSFVLDASMTLAWCLDDPKAQAADLIQRAMHSETAIVPPIWELEVANVLVVSERRNRISEGATNRFLAKLLELPIEIVPQDSARTFGRVIELARSEGLSAYDASYLELATRLELPLATLDKALENSAVRLGVPMFRAENSD